MTMKVYEFGLAWFAPPLTVFASSDAQARDIFRRWQETHKIRAQPGLGKFIYEGSLLKARPQLALAVGRKAAGVGYWCEMPGEWIIVDPEVESLGRIAPIEVGVECYEVEAEDGEDALVFADQSSDALTLYLAYHDRLGRYPSDFRISHAGIWWLRGTKAILRDEALSGNIGVAQIGADDHWHILPPDWEAN